jgi:NADPH:quinone reductase-like Zn-dependent oxidoreductase
MNGLTARLALDVLDLDPGQWLAVTGAAGAVGGYTLELAQAEGLQVVADASTADRKLVEGLGADVGVERGPGVADRVRSVVPQGGDGVVDAALLNELAAPAVHDGGGVATLRGFTGRPDRDIAWHPVYVRDYALAHGKLDQLRDLVEAGSVTLRVARTFSAVAAPEAHRLLEAGGVRGRLVLEF